MNKPSTIKVWDIFVRLFHWLLVASFAISWFTQEQQYENHLWAGYTVLTLICLRTVWGFVGSTYARFKNFIPTPKVLINYVHSIITKRSPRYIGHNPAGGIMIVLMLLTLLTITSSGIALDGAENWSGPLAEFNLYHYTDQIKSLHIMSTNVLLALIVLHLLGVLHSSISHRENLVKAMISGHKSTE
jgi:cytochrome b